MKAPFSTPNNSASTSSGGIAAQLIEMSGCEDLGLMEWSAFAKHSLPTPLSPKNKTVESVGATFLTRLATALNPAEAPTNPSKDASSCCL